MVYWNMRNKTAKWVALYGMLISLAFIFSYIEAVIPIPIPVPGVKLGLANLVSIIGLYTVGDQRYDSGITGSYCFSWIYIR